MKTLILIALAVLINTQVGLVALAQNQKWKVYSPTDKTFSVVVPESTNNIEPPVVRQGSCSIDGPSVERSLRETIPLETRFGIVVLDGRAGILGTLPRRRALERLSWSYIADDDDPRFFRSPEKVQSDRLVGREYFYVRDSETPLFARGRIFDTGARIYVLVFRARNLQDLVSTDANRFFESFHLLKPR
jgi:hypothetical protein